MDIKEEVYVKEEPLSNHDFELKSEIKIYTETLAIRREICCGEKKCQCNQVGEVFFLGSQPIDSLRTSIKDNEQKEYPYQNNQRGKDITQNKNLEKHTRTHIEEKRYLCSHCAKAFSKLSHLKRHMKTHTGEKAYKCHQCDKAFKENGDLNRHLRAHTGEKPYQCSKCDKAFSQNSDLKIHVRTHTGEKPYNCSHCDKAFSQLNHLKTHMKTLSHTKEKEISMQLF